MADHNTQASAGDPFLDPLLQLDEEGASNPHGMTSTPPLDPLLGFPHFHENPQSLYEGDHVFDPSHHTLNDPADEDILAWELTYWEHHQVPVESATPQKPTHDQYLAATAEGQPLVSAYTFRTANATDSTTDEIPWEDYLDNTDHIFPDVSEYTEQGPQPLKDTPHTTNFDDGKLPDFSDMPVSDTEVTPDEIANIINGGSPSLAPVFQYEVPNLAQPEDLPYLSPAVAPTPEFLDDNIDPELRIDPTPINIVAEQPAAPIQPQLPPQETARPPARIKIPRIHTYSKRASCVGQEKVHGNAGKKRAHKDTGKPDINVYKCDQCGDMYDELGKMTNHVRHKSGHKIEEVTISWVGDGTTQPAKYFISGETYFQRVHRQKAELEARRQATKTNKRKAPEPAPEPEGQAPNPPARKRRAATKKTQPEEPEEPTPPKTRRVPRKRKFERSPVPEPESGAEEERRKRARKTPDNEANE